MPLYVLIEVSILENLARKLSHIDKIETWKHYCSAYDSATKKAAFELGQVL